MNSSQNIGVVLFQLGGPDSLAAVEPFLYNLFCDPDIINFPGAFLARKPLARFIASRRHKHAAAHYAEIGGKSPIIDLTNQQAAALESELNKTVRARVFVAMRYWHPLTEEAIALMKKEQLSKIVLLPLYPQFSKATTYSSMKEWNRQCRIRRYRDVPATSVCCFYQHPMYAEAVADNINIAYSRFAALPPGDIDLIFSAHGVPVSIINEGDPYQLHIEETVRLVCKQGGWASPHHLCYQSRLGPAEWLRPSLIETLRTLAAKKRKNAIVIPIAFVTEHIETLHEIDIEAREEAKRLGFERFEMMPALNSSPKFIRCLADLVLRGAQPGTMTCSMLHTSHPGRIAPSLCPSWPKGV